MQKGYLLACLRNMRREIQNPKTKFKGPYRGYFLDMLNNLEREIESYVDDSEVPNMSRTDEER